ncbi:MAG: response regulator [Nitrospinae bacterium]|nr:response regulator [Nitrospinota bacterium]
MAKILVIDDSGYQRSVIRQLLESEKHQVIEAPDGVEGLAAAKRERPALILTDIVMPNMQGMEFLQKMKDEKVGIPVVVVTADIQETTLKQCQNLGAAGLVNKPLKGAAADTLRNLIKVYTEG